MFILTELTVIERLAVLEQRTRLIKDFFEAGAIADDIKKIIAEVGPELERLEFIETVEYWNEYK